jgi:hypothetical protein
VPFDLSHVLRSDVAQADVAPLMAAVLGLDWPVNSVGVLPDVDPDVWGGGYLRMREAGKGRAQVGLVNAQVSSTGRLLRNGRWKIMNCVWVQVILEQYRVKHGSSTPFPLAYGACR